MTKEEYRAAFSRLQPSQEAVDRLLAIPEEQPKRRRPIRLGSLIAAAIVVVLLLGGTVYAASHWFRMSAEPTLTERPHKEVDGPTQPTDPPKPQVGIEIEDAGSGNYVGFTLDGFSIGLGLGAGYKLSRLFGVTGEVQVDYNFSKEVLLSVMPGVAFNLREVWPWAKRTLSSTWISFEIGGLKTFNRGIDGWSNTYFLGIQFGA
jgi:hypothetical protein